MLISGSIRAKEDWPCDLANLVVNQTMLTSRMMSEIIEVLFATSIQDVNPLLGAGIFNGHVSLQVDELVPSRG